MKQCVSNIICMENTMNKKELTTKVADIMGVTSKEASMAVDTVIDVIADTVNNGGKVSLTGFGVFEVVKRNERKCRNMMTEEVIVVPAKMAPKFRPSKALKMSVAKLAIR